MGNRIALGCLLVSLGARCGRRAAVTGDVAIVGVTVIDGTDQGARADQTVVVAGEKIVAVGPAGRIAAQVGTTIDGRGKYLIPGLWDMHVHLYGYGERAFPLFLANGVTTIRDLSGNLASSLWLRQETHYGRILGPTMLIAGPTLDSPYIVRAVQGTPNAAAREAVPDSASAVRMVDSLSRVGVDQIKVHSMTPRTAYFAILAEGARRGIPVVGHVPDSVGAEEAIRGGQRTIEHLFRLPEAMSRRGAEITRWMLAAMQRGLDRTRARPRVEAIFPFRLAAADSAERSFDPATAGGFARLAANSQVWFDPTLVVMEAVFRINEPAVRSPPELQYAPRAVRELDEGLKPEPNPTAADVAEGRRRFQAAVQGLKPLIRAGAKFVAGTDVPVFPLVPGFALQRELGLLVEAGLTPLQAIQAATRNAAAAAGQLASSGTIEVGKTASLVLLDADPLTAIGNTRKIRTVISRGRLLDRATLDRLLADARAYASQR